MKNVTITMDDDALEWARIEAARHNKSVSRMVGEMVTERMRADRSYATAMREALEFEPIEFERSYLKRDEIYAERLDRFR